MTAKRLPALLLTSLAILPAAGCESAAVPPTARLEAPVSSDAEAYKLHPGDTIKVTVYDEESLSGIYAVDAQGQITMPLAGNIAAQGKTKEELQTEVRSVLETGGYLSHPQVSVDIAATRPFYILGQVRSPGSYNYQPGIDVFKAIAMAGGYTPRAAKNKILIERGEGAEKQHFNATEQAMILPGDSITVRERLF